VSNIIYLDSPTGVGFSYSKNYSKYSTGDKQTASDTHAFLLKVLPKRETTLPFDKRMIYTQCYIYIYIYIYFIFFLFFLFLLGSGLSNFQSSRLIHFIFLGSLILEFTYPL